MDYSTLIRSTPGVVSAWPLNEAGGAGTADDLISTNDGTPTDVTFGSTSLVAPHTSADFNNSTSIVSVPDAAALDVTTAITAEAWINWDGGAGFDAILTKWADAVGYQYLFGIDAATGKLTFYLSTTVSGIVAAVGATTLVPGTPYHVAGSFGGTSHRVYVNGVEDGSRTTTGSMLGTSATVGLGAHADGGNPYDGRIAWLALYDVALTADQIKRHYAIGRGMREIATMGVG